MGLSRRERPSRLLLVIAPTLHEAWHAMREHGLDPVACDGFRHIGTAHALRGTTHGSPYIMIHRDSWAATPRGAELDQALTVMQRTGRVRPAREDDLDACRLFPVGEAAAE